MMATIIPARIHKVEPSPSRSAIFPATLGANTPPTISLIPMVRDRAVAVPADPTISDGMVAMASGNTPLSAAPTAMQAMSGASCVPLMDNKPSGSTRPINDAVIMTGLRPNLSEEPGTRNATAMDATPKDDMIQLMCCWSKPRTWMRYRGVNVNSTMRYATSSEKKCITPAEVTRHPHDDERTERIREQIRAEVLRHALCQPPVLVRHFRRDQRLCDGHDAALRDAHQQAGAHQPRESVGKPG